MYKLILLCISLFCLCITLPSMAQTKKIALRSHNGSTTTFTLASPDEFGMVPPSRYRELHLPIRIESIHARELSIQDSFATCRPIPDSLYYPKAKSILPKKQPKNKSQKSKNNTPPRALLLPKEKEQVNTVAKSVPPQPLEGKTNWMGCLLFFPLVFVFHNSFKS